MIVRIHADNQYRLDDQHGQQLAQLDDQLVAAMEANDSARFGTLLGQVVAFVQASGTPVGMEEVVPSDVIVPAPDMSLAEARQLLAKEHVVAATSPAPEAAEMASATDDDGEQG